MQAMTIAQVTARKDLCSHRASLAGGTFHPSRCYSLPSLVGMLWISCSGLPPALHCPFFLLDFLTFLYQGLQKAACFNPSLSEFFLLGLPSVVSFTCRMPNQFSWGNVKTRSMKGQRMDAGCDFYDPRPLLLARIRLVLSSLMVAFGTPSVAPPFLDLQQRASFGAYSSLAPSCNRGNWCPRCLVLVGHWFIFWDLQEVPLLQHSDFQTDIYFSSCFPDLRYDMDFGFSE
jgi:hypothetical protein